MKRLQEQAFLDWKNSKHRLPLLVKGARQVGKTYLIQEFSRNCFEKSHYFNFERNRSLHKVFSGDLDISKIITDLSFHAGVNIGKNDLIIFDEVQECPTALTSLKYFAEEQPDRPIICAGSLLGLTLADDSFPVGKVDYLWLGPLSFEEFLLGTEDSIGYKALKGLQTKLEVTETAHAHLFKKFIHYLITGGMPRAVVEYHDATIENRHDISAVFDRVRRIQDGLIRDFQNDFSKHTTPSNSALIRAIFNNIPQQLQSAEDRTTTKFKFSEALEGRHVGFSRLQTPIEWLERAGLIYRVKIANQANNPLAYFSKDSVFKLYLLDVGILGALLQLPPAILLSDDYGTAKGFFAENLVLQGLVKSDLHGVYCWTEGSAEIEFIKTINSKIVPIEVKSGRHTRAKSLDSFVRRYSPKIAVKFYNGLPAYDRNKKVHLLPLYLAWDIERLPLS